MQGIGKWGFGMNGKCYEPTNLQYPKRPFTLGVWSKVQRVEFNLRGWERKVEELGC